MKFTAPIPEDTSSGVQKVNEDLHNRKLFVVLLCIIQVPDKHSAGSRHTLVVCVAIAFLQRKNGSSEKSRLRQDYIFPCPGLEYQIISIC